MEKKSKVILNSGFVLRDATRMETPRPFEQRILTMFISVFPGRRNSPFSSVNESANFETPWLTNKHIWQTLLAKASTPSRQYSTSSTIAGVAESGSSFRESWWHTSQVGVCQPSREVLKTASGKGLQAMFLDEGVHGLNSNLRLYSCAALLLRGREAKRGSRCHHRSSLVDGPRTLYARENPSLLL
jgi:hypothetical protein